MAGQGLDLFDLQRFVDAQAPVYPTALEELKAGRKRTHWMWFVFPQMRGLGASDMAVRYGIGSIAEAHAYLAHPVLGPRLAECTAAVLAVEGRTLNQIFGTPDDMKFRSSMTLFDAADGKAGNVCAQAIAKYCGSADQHTLDLIGE